MGMPRLFLKSRITSVTVDNKKEINFYTDRKTNCVRIMFLGRVIRVTRLGDEVHFMHRLDKEFAFISSTMTSCNQDVEMRKNE